MSDDTQDPNREPGCEDVPVIRLVGTDDAVEFTLTPGHAPHPPSGICLVGDVWSDVVSSPPNPGNGNLDWERIIGLCQRLQRTPAIIWRVEELLGLHAIGDNGDRIGSIAKALGERKGYIENAEHLVEMGS